MRWISLAICLSGCVMVNDVPGIPDAAAGDADGGVLQAADDAGVTAFCATDAGASGKLVERCAGGIASVSPDGRVLIWRTGPDTHTGLALTGNVPDLVSAGIAAAGSFTPDGAYIWFTRGAPPELYLALGSIAVRGLAASTDLGTLRAVGRWIYYTDQVAEKISLYRIRPTLGGGPELLAAFALPQSLQWTTSPDGESVAWCGGSSTAPDCSLRPFGSASALKLPGPFHRLRIWAPDGSWLLLDPCSLVDMAGNVRTLGCASFQASTLALSPDGARLAALQQTSAGVDVHLTSTVTGADVILPRPGPVDINVFRPRYEVRFTPDGSRVVATIGHASFSARIAQPAWTMVSNDHGAVSMSEPVPVEVSPDSRIVADWSVAIGAMVQSVDGAAPRSIGAPDGALLGLPTYEPAGGLGKAIFAGAGWLTNADCTGTWQQLGKRFQSCAWTGRTAVCVVSHPDAATVVSYDLTAVTEDGKQVDLARNAIDHAATGSKLFYIASSGGLYAVDLPQPP